MNEEYIQHLSNEELKVLKQLIGKSICTIQSDYVRLNPNQPTLYTFYEWVEITNWDNLNVMACKYIFGETKKGDDFMQLAITTSVAHRRAKNASISFSKFIINKIEVYGYSHEAQINPDLKQITSEENILLLYSSDGRMVCIECLYAMLDVRVTLDEELILLALTKPDCQGKILLKHTI